MAEFDYLWKGGPEFAQSENFRFGTDSVLLGNFITVSGAKSGIDLGCASGVISMLLLARNSRLHMTGIEIDQEAAALASENMAHNKLEDRSRIVNSDLRNYRELFRSGSFDLVVSNPPYFPVSSGDVSPDIRRATARGEVSCTLEDLCSAAEFLCRWDGKVAFVHRPERLTEVFDTMRRHSIEPKRLRLVAHTADSVPSLILVEGRRGGKSGLKIEPLLILKNPDGTDTDEIKRIYHRDQ
ncbi:MAG: tRNA1(Val) (adenine(37)-N6)-methyltransferase [Eubacteriales bacterium]|nr:tRNA1(Val) (adenine(37)-N6)-methyltransferase [Eubacteriales bacterium]